MTISPAKDTSMLSLKTFADAESVLAEALPGYESRAPQQTLAEGIERLMSKPENFTPYGGAEEDYREWVRPGVTHFLGQAGTGVGKSLGYLIPALLSGRRTIVSVTTKALQAQLAQKDMPFLEEHLGIDFSWTMLKGRSNYLCLNRLALLTQNDVPDLPRISALIQDEDFDGEQETINKALGFELPYAQWNLMCSDSDECMDNGCKPITCYAERARAIAKGSNVVIVNHALFFTDLMVKNWGKSGMLGEYEVVVFDEAHEMEEIAGNTLGGQVSEGSFMSMCSQVRRWANDHADDQGEAVGEPLALTLASVTAFFEALGEGRLTNPKINEVQPQATALYGALSDLRTALYQTKIDHAADHQKAYKRKRALVRLAGSLDSRMFDIIASPQEENVRWVEKERTRRGEERKVVKVAPINVAPFLFQNLFSKTPCVLVSATLAVKQRFDYISSRLGIGPEFEGLDVGTPFDYRTQARLFVPVMAGDRPFPEPKGSDQAAWKGVVNHYISGLLRASHGRALVLFTSVAHMREAADVARMALGNDLDIRMQYEAPTNQLTEWLKGHEPGAKGRVVFATRSFFTGVDIPGDALSLVIICKMPFPVPDEPLYQARCEAIEAKGGSSFSDYTMPLMSLVLQQAAGRLIRHRNDKGVVAVLDPRLATKGYGKQIMRDLPPMSRTFDLADVEAFLEEAA